MYSSWQDVIMLGAVQGPWLEQYRVLVKARPALGYIIIIIIITMHDALAKLSHIHIV